MVTPTTIASFAALPEGFLIGCAAVFGLLVGSFLNVVIYRLPKMMTYGEANYIAELRSEPLPHPEPFNLLLPRSACPECGTQIGAFQNIPVISYLLLGGKCRACKAPIPLRYPLIEVAASVLSVLAFIQFGPSWQAVVACGLVWTLLALTAIDAQTQFLPDQLTLPLIWAGLLVNLFGLFTTLESAVIGAMVGYGSLWTIFWLFKLIRGKEGMGYGDFKLMAAVGAWLGWQVLPTAILLSSLVGAVYGITMMAAKKMGQENPFSFGPFIAGAGLILLFWGHRLPAFFPFQ